MNTDIVSIDTIIIEELAEKTGIPVNTEADGSPPGTSLPASRRFGIVDMWKIRNRKKPFRNYLVSDGFSI